MYLFWYVYGHTSHLLVIICINLLLFNSKVLMPQRFAFVLKQTVSRPMSPRVIINNGLGLHEPDELYIYRLYRPVAESTWLDLIYFEYISKHLFYTWNHTTVLILNQWYTCQLPSTRNNIIIKVIWVGIINNNIIF